MANPLPWFKFYGGEYLSDPKILQLTAQERSCWLTLLCLASQTKDGTVRFLSESQLIALSGADKEIKGVLSKFENLMMIRTCNGNVTITNWEKRQKSESYTRVQRFRKKDGNANVTDRIEENRGDKRRINTNTASNEARMGVRIHTDGLTHIGDLAKRATESVPRLK